MQLFCLKKIRPPYWIGSKMQSKTLTRLRAPLLHTFILSGLHSWKYDCIITLHHHSVTIMSHPIYLSIHVTIYYLFLCICADEGPWSKTFCNNCCQSAMISSLKLPKWLLHVAMSIHESIQKQNKQASQLHQTRSCNHATWFGIMAKDVGMM